MHYWGRKVNDEGRKSAESQIKSCAKIMNDHLSGTAWLVGGRITLADIVAFNILITVFRFTFDVGVCKAFPNLAAWFTKMSKIPVVTQTAGYVKIKGSTS